MIDPPPIARRRAIVGDPSGLHLRTAHQFVYLIQRYTAEIRVRCGEAEAHGGSI
jgi:phosphotransferase system HPr-like phosphotransfer protein